MRSFSKLKLLKRFFSLLIIEQEKLYISSANIQFLLFWLLLSNLLFTEIIFAVDLQRNNPEIIRQIKQNLFPFKIKSPMLSINQILLLLLSKILIVILMITFYKKNFKKNDFFNDQYQKGFFYFTKKILFLGGYQILIIPSFLFCMETNDKFYAQAFYYCDRFFSLILILYSFIVYFIGIPEFGKSQERQKSSRVLFFLLLKFWLTVFYLKYKFLYKRQQKNDLFCFIQCILCFVIIQKLQKNPFLNLKTNITTYYIVSITTAYQVIFFFLSKFQVNQQQSNIRVKLLITIPFIIKFLDLYKKKFWKIDKQEFLEYCFQNDSRQVLKIRNKQKINFDIINYMKKHFMECANPSCTCTMKNPINISRKNQKQQYPNQIKSPCLYTQLAQEILIQDIKRSKNFRGRYFCYSRLCLYYGKYDNLLFFRNIKQELDSQFFDPYFCEKIIQYASQYVENAEIIYNKNDLKYIKPQSIQKFKTYEEQVMQHVQNFLQTLKLLIYESQARTYRIPKIKLLNEKLYQIINQYVEVYSKIQNSLKLKKLHKLFFDNFIFVKQPCFKKIYRKSLKKLENYQTENSLAHRMCQQEKWQFFVLDFSYQDLAVIRQTSNKIYTFLGYEKSELINQSINKIICQEFSQIHDNYVTEFLKTGIKKFTLDYHQVFLEHKKGYTEQIHLQQKFFICQKNKSLQNFTLMKRLAYNRQNYIIANKQGQILNYTEQFLRQYPSFKNQDEKINICQIIPNSVRWLILLNQKNLTKMNSEQINVWLFNQMGMQNKFLKILDWIFFSKREKFGQEKNEIFHHFFNKCLYAPQSVNKEIIVKKVQAKAQQFQVCFYSKQQILYKLSFLNIQNYFRTIIQIVDQKENPTNNLFTKSKLLDFFVKIVLIKIYLERWQKLKNKKKQNLFGLRQFNDNQNKTKTPKLNQKDYFCYQGKNKDTDLQLQTKQHVHSRTILNIVKNKHSSIYLKFYIFVIIVYFCAPIIVILGTQQQNSGVFSQSVLDFKNHQAETEMLNKLKIYKLLKTNFPEYKIITNTIENHILEQLKIYFNGLLSKKRQNKLFQQNFVQNLSAECYEIILQQFYRTQNTLLYQNMDFNQITINCKDNNHEKIQKYKTSKYSLYYLLLGFAIQLICALGLIIIEFSISKFMNSVYKFPVNIIKPQNYLNKIDAFLNHFNIQTEYQQQTFNKNQAFKAKNFVFIKPKKLSILLLFIISAIIVSLKIYLYGSVYQEFYTQIDKIKITKEAHNSRFSELFLISNDRSKNTTNQKLKKYENFEVPHITFFQYFDNNEQFQNQLTKEIYDILYSYQVFQTMKDLNFMIKDSKYYFVLLDFFLRNFLSKKNKPIFETRWLLNYQVYNLISQDLFDRYSKMMINPFEQKLKVFSNEVLITTIILNIFLFIFLCECCLKKKQQEIEMSLYVFRFVNTKKLKQNKVFMNFMQKLKAEEQIIIFLVNVIYQNFQIVHSNAFHKKSIILQNQKMFLFTYFLKNISKKIILEKIQFQQNIQLVFHNMINIFIYINKIFQTYYK